MPRAEEIKSAIQLLVEGNDPRNFFEAFVEHLSLANIQIQNFGGVYELGGFLRALVNAPDFQIVQSIGIVRDAETSAERAFQSVQSSLERVRLPMPDNPAERTDTSPAVTVLILPGDNRQGMLETLYFARALRMISVEGCIDDFFKCVESLPDVSIERSDKARAHAYLTTKPNPHFSVGVAAKNDYWDLNHSVFSTVRDFLQMIAASSSVNGHRRG